MAKGHSVTKNPNLRTAFRVLWRVGYVAIIGLLGACLPFFNDFVALLGGVAFWPLTIGLVRVLATSICVCNEYMCLQVCVSMLHATNHSQSPCGASSTSLVFGRALRCKLFLLYALLSRLSQWWAPSKPLWPTPSVTMLGFNPCPSSDITLSSTDLGTPGSEFRGPNHTHLVGGGVPYLLFIPLGNDQRLLVKTACKQCPSICRRCCA